MIELVNKIGPKKWSTIAQHLPGRIGKQCRERYGCWISLILSHIIQVSFAHNYFSPVSMKFIVVSLEDFRASLFL